MGATSEYLKHDIDLKREEIGEHVAALSDHVAPRPRCPAKMAERSLLSARHV